MRSNPRPLGLVTIFLLSDHRSSFGGGLLRGRTRGNWRPDPKQLEAAYAKTDQEHDSADDIRELGNVGDEPACEYD